MTVSENKDLSENIFDYKTDHMQFMYDSIL